jgi:branched-chain amino acid aminotransferase
MIICLNGKCVPEEQAVVSVLDRGFLYGDGLFEGVRISNGQLFRWNQHLDRLQRGADFLKLRLPFTNTEMQQFAWRLIQENDMREGMLRVVLSRGVGLRGYSPRGADSPTLVISVHPAPQNQAKAQWRLHTTRYQVHPGEPIAQFKTCNKLVQVLARAEAEEAGADEGLLTTPDGMVAEATSGNIFWIQNGVVITPPLQKGVLPGITRSLVLELCDDGGIPYEEAVMSPVALQQAEGVFVSLTSWGIMEASHLDGRALAVSPWTRKLREAYLKQLQDETGKSSN